MDPELLLAGEALVRRYLASLPDHDLDGVLSCFAPGAIIASPTFGIQRAADFYPRLFTDSLFTEISHPRLFCAIDSSFDWIAAFDYRWQRMGQEPVNTRLVDRFALTRDATAIVALEVNNIGPRPVPETDPADAAGSVGVVPIRT